jgi:hypothetical protein
MGGVFGVQLLTNLLLFFFAPIIGVSSSNIGLPVLLRRALSFMLWPPLILGALGVGVVATILPRNTLVQKPWLSSLWLALTFVGVVSIGSVAMDVIELRPVRSPNSAALFGVLPIFGVGHLLKWTIKERNL